MERSAGLMTFRLLGTPFTERDADGDSSSEGSVSDSSVDDDLGFDESEIQVFVNTRIAGLDRAVRRAMHQDPKYLSDALFKLVGRAQRAIERNTRDVRVAKRARSWPPPSFPPRLLRRECTRTRNLTWNARCVGYRPHTSEHGRRTQRSSSTSNMRPSCTRYAPAPSIRTACVRKMMQIPLLLAAARQESRNRTRNDTCCGTSALRVVLSRQHAVPASQSPGDALSGH